jgi:DNA-nicking Smr family endonuclease
MASKARAKRTAKKARATEPPDSFFRPFAALVEERKRAEHKKKEEQKKAEKAAALEKKKAEREPVPEPKSAAPRRDEQANAAAVAETFAMYMAGVAMLDDRKNRRVPRTETVPARNQPQPAGAPAVDLDADARARLRSLVSEGVRFEVLDDGERIEGRRIDIDPRELRRLRRGAYTIDGRLDLHGMTVVEARQKIEAFVRKRRADGDRVIALIHGRGNHSPRGVAVLRGEIAAWLSQGPVAHHVAAFTSAPPDEGGTGALLVLLAR